MSSASTELKTAQKEMSEKLQALGLPYREIKVYGSQITVECLGAETIERWRAVLIRFARIRGLIETYVDAKKNEGTCLAPTQVKVWRLYAAI